MKILSSSPLKNPPWPWSKVDVTEFGDLALQNKIILPNIGIFDIGENISWRIPDGGAANSKRLWLNSLYFVQILLERFKISGDRRYIVHAKYLFDSYFSCLDKDEELQKVAWRDEHAVANRLSVLVAVLHASANGIDLAGISEARLLWLIEVHAEWLMIDQHYVNNNHGVMMDMALLNAAILVSGMALKESSSWISKATQRINKMLNITFDEDGCCTENSPTYHYVNYSLFNAAQKFLTSHDIHFPEEAAWKEKLAKVLRVGHILVRPDGGLPLIGDSESRIGTFFPSDKGVLSERFGYYPNSGLFVYKCDDIYFTLKGGGCSFSHRHLDDTSITLFYKGQDFIVDAGMYSYDIGDKMRRWFISHRAHSGFYLESASNARFASYAGPKELGGLEDLTLRENGFAIQAWHNLCHQSKIVRNISLAEQSILLTDQFSAGSECDWRQIFQLHPGCQVELGPDGRSAVITNGSVSIKMLIITEGFELTIEKGHYSEKFMTKQDTLAVVIKGASKNVVLETKISLL